MDAEQLVRETWKAVADGDFDALEAVLAPDAKWRAVEDGPWNCESRSAILGVMRRNRENGLGGAVEDVFDVGERTVVAFRPERAGPPAWPLDHGIRYVVLSIRDGLITEMKGCANRQAACAYAQAG